MAKLNLKVGRYFELYQEIKKQRLTGAWESKRKDLTGTGSMGTNEYGDLFDVLDEFYDKAETVFGSVSKLDSLTDDQIENLNKAADSISIKGLDVNSAVLRANGVMGALTMTMQVLDAEAALVEAKKDLVSSKVATEIKNDVLDRIASLENGIKDYAKTLKADFSKGVSGEIDRKLDKFYDYLSDTVFDQVYDIPNQVQALIAPEVVTALSSVSAADALNSTLFQALHSNIDEVKANVAGLKTFVQDAATANSAERAETATSIITAVNLKSGKLSKKAVKEIKGSFGRGIKRLTEAINTEHEFNQKEYKEIKDLLVEIQNANAAADAETQRKLNDVLAKLDQAIKQGNKKLTTALLITAICLGTAFGGVAVADLVIDLNQRNGNTYNSQQYVLTPDEQAALLFGSVENAEFLTFMDGLAQTPAGVSAISARAAANVDSHLGYTLDGTTIKSSVGETYDISTFDGKQAYANNLSVTYKDYLNAGLPLSEVANEYVNAASLDDWNINSGWGGELYAKQNTTNAMRASLELYNNQEAHTADDLLTEEQRQKLEKYDSLLGILENKGYAGDDLATFLDNLSNNSITGLYNEMKEAGLVSGEQTTVDGMKAEILAIEKEAHTADDLLTEEQRQKLEKYDSLLGILENKGYAGDDLATFLDNLSNNSITGLYNEMKEKGLVSGDKTTVEDMKKEILAIEKEAHNKEYLDSLSDEAIKGLYNEMKEKGLVSGEKTTVEDMKAEILAIEKEAHTDDQILTEEQKQKLEKYEQLIEASNKYSSLRQLLEQKYDGDASQMSDEELLTAVLANANMGEYAEVCSKVFAAYESVFGAGSSNGKDVATCLENMVQHINDLAASAGSISKEDAAVLCRILGIEYDTSKTPEENYLEALKLLGYDAELDNGNVDQDTPNKNYTGSQMGD